MSLTEDVILTDICSKSNKKIIYSKIREDDNGPVLITPGNIAYWKSWHYLSCVVKDIFLPKGYPDSVSSDYLEYQLWDTLQAFCSSISGTLAMTSVMKGIGVGSDAATPISAAITWLIKDGTGMAGSVLFTWLKGSSFDADCKKWRLFADILNDVALFIELLIPFVMNFSVYMLLIATSLKSLVGTAGSSTRVAFITHQAIKGNIADVSAKDGSQEILTNLCAFLVGIFFLKNLTETHQIWTVMCISALFHIIFNYNAVRCLKMNIFNIERFCICLRAYFPTSIVPTIAHVNNWESLFLFRGLKDVKICNFSIKLGASIEKVLGSQTFSGSQFLAISSYFEDKPYFILTDIEKRKLYVTFRETFTEMEVLKSYFHAFLIGITVTVLEKETKLDVVLRSRKNSPIYRLKNVLNEYLSMTPEDTLREQQNRIMMQAYMICEDFIDKEFLAFIGACHERGWCLEKHLINIGDWRANWTYRTDVVHQASGIPKTRRLRRRAIQKDVNLLLIH